MSRMASDGVYNGKRPEDLDITYQRNGLVLFENLRTDVHCHDYTLVSGDTKVTLAKFLFVLQTEYVMCDKSEDCSLAIASNYLAQFVDALHYIEVKPEAIVPVFLAARHYGMRNLTNFLMSRFTSESFSNLDMKTAQMFTMVATRCMLLTKQQLMAKIRIEALDELEVDYVDSYTLTKALQVCTKQYHHMVSMLPVRSTDRAVDHQRTLMDHLMKDNGTSIREIPFTEILFNWSYRARQNNLRVCTAVLKAVSPIDPFRNAGSHIEMRDIETDGIQFSNLLRQLHGLPAPTSSIQELYIAEMMQLQSRYVMFHDILYSSCKPSEAVLSSLLSLSSLMSRTNIINALRFMADNNLPATPPYLKWLNENMATAMRFFHSEWKHFGLWRLVHKKRLLESSYAQLHNLAASEVHSGRYVMLQIDNTVYGGIYKERRRVPSFVLYKVCVIKGDSHIEFNNFSREGGSPSDLFLRVTTGGQRHSMYSNGTVWTETTAFKDLVY